MKSSATRNLLNPLPACLALVLLLPLGACENQGERSGLARSHALHEQGRYRESVEDLRAHVDADPADGEANLLLGTALFHSGDAGLAVWPLRRASEDPRFAVPASLLLARAMLDSRTAPDALPVIDRVLELEPDNINALSLRSRAYLATGKLVDGLADIDRVLERDPDNISALVPRVTTLIALELIDDAEVALATAQERIAKTDEDISDAMKARLCIAGAMFSFEKEDLDLAETRYAECLEAYPLNALVVTETAAYYDRRDRAEEATQLLRDKLEETKNSFFRLALARRMGALGEFQEEEALLREEAETAANGQAWFALADLYVQRENFEEAVLAFERALASERAPSSMLRFAYADTLVQAERFEKASGVAETLEQPALRDLIRGRILLAEGDPAGALEAFTSGIRLWPNNPSGRYLAGEAAEGTGDFERAMSEYRESLRANPGFTRAGLSLAELQALRGMDGLAIASLNRYLAVRPTDVEALILSARVAHRTGRHNMAAGALRRLAAIPGHQALAAAEEATLLAADQGAELAVAAIERTQLDLTDPANLPGLEGLVLHLAEAGLHERALERVAAAIDTYPDDAALLTLDGRVRERAWQSPRESYDRALALVPDYAPALAGLASLSEAGGDLESALELNERAATALPSDPQAAMDAARLLAELDRKEECVERLKALLLAHPREARAALLLAKVLAEMGELERAESLSERARWLGAPDAEAALERIRSMRGESAQAQDDPAST